MMLEHTARLTFHKIRVMISAVVFRDSLHLIFNNPSFAYCRVDRFATQIQRFMYSKRV